MRKKEKEKIGRRWWVSPKGRAVTDPNSSVVVWNGKHGRR